MRAPEARNNHCGTEDSNHFGRIQKSQNRHNGPAPIPEGARSHRDVRFGRDMLPHIARMRANISLIAEELLNPQAAEFVGCRTSACCGDQAAIHPTRRRSAKRLGWPAVITRMSELFLRTLRDDPADAELASHKLLIRAGYVRPIAPGLYSWLPLGLRVLRNIERVVREEMNAIGGQEILFPALLPRAPYETTNRWTEYGDGVFRLRDRRGNDYLLGPTHEELFALTVKGEYSSYKDL